MKISIVCNLAVAAALVSFADAAFAQSTQTGRQQSGALAQFNADSGADVLHALPPGMTRLFDGKTLDGWVQIPPDTWTVKDGAIASLGAGRGVIYTAKRFSRYRIIFDIRHVSGNPDHQACVLVFCTAPAAGQKPPDALAGIQFQVPNGGHWDYRKGHNNSGSGEFTTVNRVKFDVHEWSRVELLVDAKSGTARMAVAQPPGAKAVEILDFKEPTAGRTGPFALQMHNKGLFDEYANIAIEVDPASDELITIK